jgi:hypothetical protein
MPKTTRTKKQEKDAAAEREAVVARVKELLSAHGLRHIDCARAIDLTTREAFRLRLVSGNLPRPDLEKLATLFGVPFAEAFPMASD